VPVSFSSWNTGVSSTRNLTYIPTPKRTMLSRKGTRQPQDKNASSGKSATRKIIAVESTSPRGTPI
jgi:hypothetical protein